MIKKTNTLLQRAFIALCFIIISSCSRPAFQQWQFQEIRTKSTCFNSGRMLLPPDDHCEYLEVELLRNCSGLRLFVNLFNLQARPLPDDLTRTTIKITFPDSSESYEIYPRLLAGGQRMLIEGQDADQMINKLLQGQEFFIVLGRHEMRLVLTKFAEHYQTLMNLQIDESTPCHFLNACE